jgi:hypothetical protein
VMPDSGVMLLFNSANNHGYVINYVF